MSLGYICGLCFVSKHRSHCFQLWLRFVRRIQRVVKWIPISGQKFKLYADPREGCGNGRSEAANA